LWEPELLLLLSTFCIFFLTDILKIQQIFQNSNSVRAATLEVLQIMLMSLACENA
jgi:hypothetical protein